MNQDEQDPQSFEEFLKELVVIFQVLAMILSALVVMALMQDPVFPHAEQCVQTQ